jgi:hypothetical protein
MPTTLEYEIIARNAAGPVLVQHAQDLDRVNKSNKDAQESTDKFGRGVSEAVRSVDHMTDALVMRLSPGLAGAVSQMASAARMAGQLPVALGTVVVAITAVTQVVGFYIDRIKEMQKFDVAFSQAQLRQDLGQVKGMVEANTAALDLYNRQMDSLTKPHTGFEQLIGRIQTWTTNVKGLREEMARLAPLFVQLQTQAFEQQGIQAMGGAAGGIGGMLRGQLSQFGSPEAIERNIQAQREAATLQQRVSETQIRVSLQLQEAQMRSLKLPANEEADLQRALFNLREDLLLASRVSGIAQQDAISRARNEAYMGAAQGRINTMLSRSQAAREAAAPGIGISEALQEAGISVEQLTGQYAGYLQLPRGQGFAAETARRLNTGEAPIKEDLEVVLNGLKNIGVEEEKLAAIRDRQAKFLADLPKDQKAANDLAWERIRAEQEGLAIQEKRIELWRELPGLTKVEREGLELTLSVERESLRLKAIDLQLAQERDPILHKNLEALKAYTIEQENLNRLTIQYNQLNRMDPLAGLAKGFSDAAEQANESGRIMQEMAHNTASAMVRSFDDLLFSTLTGKFENAAQVGKAFGLALLRSVTGAVAELATAPAITALKNLTAPLGAMRGIIPVGIGGLAAGAPGTAAGSPSLVSLLTGGGQASAPMMYQPVGDAGMMAVQGGLGLIGTAGGAAGLLAGGTGAAAGSGVGAGGFLVTSTGQVVSVPAQAAGVGLGSVLGAVGAGVGFLFSMYAAYQSGSPGMGALTGALGGLAAGASIGSLIPGVGTAIGAIVGLAAGAAIGAGLGALGSGKGQKGSSRRQAVAARSSLARGAYAHAIAGAQTLEELSVALNTPWGTMFGGEFTVTAAASDGTRRGIGGGMGGAIGGSPFTWLDLYDPRILESIEVHAIIANGEVWSYYDTEGTQATRDRIRQLLQGESALGAGFIETAGGISRTTMLSFPALLRGQGAGQNLFFSSEASRMAGFGDPAIASMLRQILRVNSQHDIVPDLTALRYLAI